MVQLGNRTSRRRRLRVRALVASVVAVVAASLLALAPTAGARPKLNTFSGTCTDMEGTVSWPEEALTFAPIETRMDLEFWGGRCTGTLNGRRVTDAPVEAVGRLRGIQSCEAGQQRGPFNFTIAGRRFTSDSRYFRGGAMVGVAFEGSAGGSGFLHAHVDTAPVSESDPLAQSPVVEAVPEHPVIDPILGLLIAPVTYDELLDQCGSTGVRQAPGRIEVIQTTPYMSSYDRKARK